MAQQQPPPPGAAPEGRPVTLEQALAYAVALHQRGKLGEADSIYRRVLEAVPEHPDALHFLGVLTHQRGDSEKAVELLGRVIERLPEHADAHNNLGNILVELDRHAEAEAAYRKVIELRPEYADAHNNLGVALKVQARYAEGEQALRRAIELDPTHGEAWHNLGNVLHRLERDEEAIPAYQRAIELQPFDARNYTQLAAVYRITGRPERAADVYRRWLVHEPDSAVAKHMLAATEGGPPPDRAPAELVRALFDPFASSFDRVLQGLDYKAPELVRDALEAVAGAPARALTVLDAGCGTGLCGPLLRPFARRLVGVDLSPKMIAKSSGRGTYDELVAADLTAYLKEHEAEFDAVASADTLCYFGDLAPLVGNAARALAFGGTLVFTVEDAEGRASEQGFRLEQHGRYSHAEGYLRAILEGVGLSTCSIVSEVLRTEHGKPVAGLLVVARRAA